MSGTLEDIIKKVSVIPRVLTGENFSWRYFDMPAEVIESSVGRDNYRMHSIKNIYELSRSIEQHGLLEPLILNYDSKTKKFNLIDGEGRFWACYMLNASTIPVQVYYDVPEEVQLRMKVALNATKARIDPQDIALFVGKLYDMIEKRRVGEGVNTRGIIGEIAEAIGRHEDATRKYHSFNQLHSLIIDYAMEHRESVVFFRAIRTGEEIPDRNKQKSFFFKYIIGEEQRMQKKIDELLTIKELSGKKRAELLELKSKMRGKHLNGKVFSEKLSSYAAQAEDEAFELKPGGKESEQYIYKIYRSFHSARKYVDSFVALMKFDGKLRESARVKASTLADKAISEYNSLLKHKSLTKLFPNGIQESDLQTEKDYAALISERASARREKTAIESIIKTPGRLEMIPVEKIILKKSQLRSRYDPLALEQLVKDIQDIGQIKPGYVTPRGDKYVLVYGHRRFKAVTIAGKKYYKAFVVDNVSELDMTLLQAVEDLSEADTAVERAKVLNNQFILMKRIARKENRTYTEEDFIKDYSHLATPKIIRQSLYFFTIDKSLQLLAANGILGYENAISIGRLRKSDQMELAYNIMTSQLKSKDVQSRISGLMANGNQATLDIEVDTSYSRILNTLESSALRPIYDLKRYLQVGNGLTETIGRILSEYNQSIQKLKDAAVER